MGEENKKTSAASYIVMGLIIGFLIGVAANEIINNSRVATSISGCMEKLPRDQYCTMIAVPSNTTIPRIYDEKI